MGLETAVPLLAEQAVNEGIVVLPTPKRVVTKSALPLES